MTLTEPKVWSAPSTYCSVGARGVGPVLLVDTAGGRRPRRAGSADVAERGREVEADRPAGRTPSATRTRPGPSWSNRQARSASGRAAARSRAGTRPTSRTPAAPGGRARRRARSSGRATGRSAGRSRRTAAARRPAARSAGRSASRRLRGAPAPRRRKARAPTLPRRMSSSSGERMRKSTGVRLLVGLSASARPHTMICWPRRRSNGPTYALT